MKPLLLVFRTFLLSSLFLIGSYNAYALSEIEPNNNLSQANGTIQDSTMNATIGGTDANDYFVTVPNDDGTVKIEFTYTAGSALNDIFLYVYNKNLGLLESKTLYNVGTTTQSDSLFVYCRQQDTIYIHFASSGNFTYAFQYTTLPSGTSDLEPNNDFLSAQAIAGNDTISGRIGYNGTQTDANDYYQTVLPIYGTMKFYIEYNNTSNSTTSDIFMYIYNKNGGLIGSKLNYNQPLGVSQDSILVYCREQDTAYIRISSSGCFSYQFYYQVDAPATNDAEPNNDFASAQLVSSTSATGGRIGYTSTQTDQNDYFLAVLPTFGTFNYYLEFDNTSNSNGSDIYTYIYNKSGGLIGSSLLYNQPLGIGYDTINIYCRELDTVYIRVASSGCFSYTFNYDVFAPTTNDIEPNNNFADAQPLLPNDTLGGRIGYVSTSADANDYFYTVLPEDGTIQYYVKYFNTSNSTASDFFSYIYNKNSGLIGSSIQYNQPLGLNEDSITVYCRAKDTVFFRVSSSGCFSYKLYYEMEVPTPTDTSGNDAFATAQAVSFSDTTYGRIGYVSTGADQNDYFLSVLPDDGTLQYIVEYTNTSGSTGSDYYSYIYNKNGGLIGSSSKFNQPLGTQIDTINVYCRAADTVYFRTTSSGCFSYKFYQNVLSSGFTDTEPNNSIATADSILLSNTLQGRIGYTSAFTDPDDYFAFNLPEYSNITAYLTFNNTSNSTGADFYVYLINSFGGVVYSESYINTPLGITVDTLNMNCLPGDTYTLRISSSGCFSYEMDFEVDVQQPSTSIEYARYGNNVAFQSDLFRVDSVYWDFDDGTGSSLKVPVKEFGIGVYNVVLTGINKTCNLVDSDTVELVVTGIEKITPNRVGKAGELGFFDMRIFGGGLDTLTEVTLSQAGTSFTPFRIASPTPAEATALFNLSGMPFGQYDINIKLSNGDEFDFPNSFTIFEDEEGYEFSTDMVGPSTVRTNRETNFTLSVENLRNRLANGVLVFVLLPKDVETNLVDVHDKKTGRYVIKGNEWDKISIDQQNFEEVYFEGNLDRFADSVVVNYDSIYAQLESVLDIEVDSLFDEPYEAKVYALYIPMIEAGGTFNLEFKLKSTSNGTLNMVSYAWPFTVRRNPTEGEILDWVHTGGMQAAAVAEYAPNPALRFVGRNAGKIDILSQVAFTEYFDWYYGVNNANPEFYSKQFTSTAYEVGGGFVPGQAKGDKAWKSAQRYKQRITKYTKNQRAFRDAMGPLNKMKPSMRNELIDAMRRYDRKINQLSPLADANTKYAALEYLKNWTGKRGLNLTQSQLEQLLYDTDTKINRPKRIKRKRVNSINSTDPNAIYGPVGYTTQNYIAQEGDKNYLITFENVDTALAPAQYVRVETKLDSSKYNLRTLTLGNVSIAGNIYFFPGDRGEYFRDIDLRPAQNYIVRVLAKADTITGKIIWQFTTLDPVTMQFIEDPFGGFLPPNNNIPEGEGSVSFSVELLDSLKASTNLSAQANIYFDENDPILTNTWMGITDVEKPASQLSPIVELENDTVMIISYSGSDIGSGIETHYLKFRINGSEWFDIDHPLPDTGSYRITGSPGFTYDFFVFAQDSVGNSENNNPEPQATIRIESPESPFNPAFQLYPNPRSSGPVYVRSNGSFPSTQVTVYDIMGRAVYQSTNNYSSGSDTEINLPKLPAGAYQFFFETKSGKTTVARLILFNAQQ